MIASTIKIFGNLGDWKEQVLLDQGIEFQQLPLHAVYFGDTQLNEGSYWYQLPVEQLWNVAFSNELPLEIAIVIMR